MKIGRTLSRTFLEEDIQTTRRLKKNYDKNQELRECRLKLQGVTVSYLPEGEDLEHPLHFNWVAKHFGHREKSHGKPSRNRIDLPQDPGPTS